MTSKNPISYPDMTSEVEMGFLHSKIMIGVDEVGRGYLAGPVVAAAAVLPADAHALLGYTSTGKRSKQALPKSKAHLVDLLEVRDSKMVPEADRLPMAEAVRKFVRGYAIAEASVEEIETLNILYASHLAMERAVANVEQSLGIRADVILVDGHIVPRAFLGRGQPLIQGDGRCFSIACASILAKVYRDELMHRFDEKYPGYGMKDHKGYPTPFHKAQIRVLGVTAIHRKRFKGVMSGVEEENQLVFSAFD